MLKADEDGRMLFLYKELLLYIFKCKWNRETGHFLTKFLTLFNSITRSTFLQCNVKYNDETIKI